MSKFRIALCAAAAALLSAGASQAGLITNGDFEIGTLDGWDVSGAIVATQESGYTGCCGFATAHPDNFVAALGGGRGTGHEVLSQSFATVAGTTYVLNYDWAFIGGQANLLDVTVGGVTHSFCCSGAPSFDFSHDSVSFVGTGLDTVSFSVFDNPQDSTDTVIDNVGVSVPEPATWAMMISGFGLAGAALRRRRSAALAA
jgi:hypothetical protein